MTSDFSWGNNHIYGWSANFAFGSLRFYGSLVEIREFIRHGIDEFAIVVSKIEQFEGRIHVNGLVVIVLA